MKTRAVWVVGSALVIVGCAGSATRAKARAPTATPLQLPADATEIDFTLVSGNALATSTRSRSIALGDREVVLAPAGHFGESTRSRAWWDETRTLLDHGLANATADTSGSADATCMDSPDVVCGFELRVFTPRGEERLQGCCTERGAHDVEAAFRRIVPPR